MRRSELLISQSRRATENLTYSDTTGISDEEFLRYLNDAQQRVLRSVVKVFPNILENTLTVSVAALSESAPKPADGFFGSRVAFVEWSHDGQEKNYYQLKRGALSEKFHGEATFPVYYIPIGSNIFLNPRPQSGGSMRVTYQKGPPSLDKRRGTVSALTPKLTLDTTTLLTEDIAAMLAEEYICVVDKDGLIKVDGLPITAIDSSTGQITTSDGTFVPSAACAVGDYVVAGKYATTHCQLPDACEPYLVAHTDWKVLKRDSSQDSQEQESELASMLAEIVDVFKQNDQDTQLIPVISTEFLGGDYWI